MDVYSQADNPFSESMLRQHKSSSAILGGSPLFSAQIIKDASAPRTAPVLGKASAACPSAIIGAEDSGGPPRTAEKVFLCGCAAAALPAMRNPL
jgi:hypothetical protein